MSVLRFSIVWVFASISSVPVVVILLLVAPVRRWRVLWLGFAAKVVARVSLRILGARVDVVNVASESLPPQAIYVANHSSGLDTILLPSFGFPAAVFVLKREALFIPVLGWMLWAGGHVFVDRSRPRSAIARLDQLAISAVEHGLSVWIMPEGTRSSTKEMGRFKPGFVRLAIQTGYPIVPIAIQGARDVWPNRTWMLRSGNVVATILPPVDTSTWCERQARQHAQDVRDLIKKELESH